MKKIITKYINKIKKNLVQRDDELKLIMGKQMCFTQKSIQANTLEDIEFKVFSQWGEDGIIEYLVSNIPIENKFFIEFGVQNYDESNTRFLMINRDWEGIVIDGSSSHIDYIQNRNYFWQFCLHTICDFITKENINSLISNKLKELKKSNNIGILSVDIDGVDYWVLKEISCINPSIIICEYNSIFANDYPLSVPYDKDFVRGDYHHSNLYFGANLKAFNDLLSEKNYTYIGSNSKKNNAFFVKTNLANKCLPNLINIKKDFSDESKIRESRGKTGELTYLSGKSRIEAIKELELINTATNEALKIKHIFS